MRSPASREDFEVLAPALATGSAPRGDRGRRGPGRRRGAGGTWPSPATTSWCWTGICRAPTATRSAASSWPGVSDGRVLMLTAAQHGRGARRGPGPSAPTTTSRSRSTSPSSSPGSGRSPAARRRPCRPVLRRRPGQPDIPPTGRATESGQRLKLSPKEFAVLACLLAVGRAAWSPPRSCWTGSGTQRADPFTTAVKTTIRRLRAQARCPAGPSTPFARAAIGSAAGVMVFRHAAGAVRAAVRGGVRRDGPGRPRARGPCRSNTHWCTPGPGDRR